VGRGSLFGPVVAAAVILDPEYRVRGLRDSKLLLPERREILAERIRQHAIAWAIAAVDAARIDQINIYQASRVAMLDAVTQLKPSADHLLIGWTAICRKGPSFTATRFPHPSLRPLSWLRLSAIAWSGSGTLCFPFTDWPPIRDTARLIISLPCVSTVLLRSTASRSRLCGMLLCRRRCWHSCWEKIRKNLFANLRSRQFRQESSRTGSSVTIAACLCG